MSMTEYDFKSKIDDVKPDLNRFFELEDAKFKVAVIEGQYAVLQEELSRAKARSAELKERLAVAVVQAKSYKVMMEVFAEDESLREQFESLLMMMKLSYPDIEQRMKITSADGVWFNE